MIVRTGTEVIRDAITKEEVFRFLAAPDGYALGIYADGRVSISEDVGGELEAEDRPVAVIRCPGCENMDGSCNIDNTRRDVIAELVRQASRNGSLARLEGQGETIEVVEEAKPAPVPAQVAVPEPTPAAPSQEEVGEGETETMAAAAQSKKDMLNVTMAETWHRKLLLIAKFGISMSHVIRHGLDLLEKDPSGGVDPDAETRLKRNVDRARTSYLFTPEELERVIVLAAKLEISKAELLRRALGCYLKTNDEKLRELIPGFKDE